MCGCCKSHGYLNSNKVLPGRSDQVRVKRYGRTNGWTFPPHPLQIVGWFFIIVFAVTHFAILVFYLPIDWIPAGIIIPAAGFVIHLAYHILALTLDPADPAVRVKGIFEKGVFDRSKQNHVIENSYCYICQTKVSSTSKHCSMCNKCIFDFDHHCKWLNNCVGGRNYKLFLGSCLSAFGTVLVMFIIDLYLLVTYVMDSENYLKKSGVKQYQLFPDLLVDKKAYIIFDSVNGLLLLVALVLLGHLLVFHGYLICNKLSTYDYIVKSRQRKAVKDVNSDAESAGEPEPSPIPDSLKSSHPPHKKDSMEHRIYEMDVYTGPEKVDENEIASRRASYDYYSARETSAHSGERDSRQIYESADMTSSREIYDKKKRRRVKSRNSSQLELLENERRESTERSGDEPDGYLSSKGSTQSIRSQDQMEGSSDNNRKSDIVLEDYSTPKVTRSSRVSATDTYKDDEEEDNSSATREDTRNESVASRPRSPSPTQTKRLSYLKQSYYANGDRVPSRLISTAEEVESIQSKSSNDFEKRIGTETGDSGFGQYDDIGSPVLSTTKSTSISRAGLRNNTETQSEGSQLSLSNAMNSNMEDDDGDGDDDDTRRSSPVSRRSETTTYQNMEQGGITNVAQEHVQEVVPTPLTSSLVYKSATKNPQNAVQSEDEQLVFEDEFVDDMTTSNNGIFDQPDVNPSLPPPPYPVSDATTDNQVSDTDELTKKKLERYVDAFRRKRDSTYSYGSDSERSEMAIAVLNEETDPSVLKDSLYRVNKLSDAFPTVVDQEAFKKRSLQQPRLRDTESMEELSVVEYNRKKKLKKKRASSSNDFRSSNLPPLRGRKPLSDTSDVNEGRNPDV